MGVIYEEICRHSIRTPNKIALIVSEDLSLTYLELIECVNKRVDRLSSILKFQDDGSKCVAIYYKDELEELITALAINASNLLLVPINAELKIDQIKLATESVNAKYLLHDLSEDLELIGVQAFQCRTQDDCNFSSNPKNLQAAVNYEHFLVTLSSGSTGNPKPIIFSEDTKIKRFQHARDTYKLHSDDVILCASPFHHSLGQRLTFLPLLLGATLVFLKRFSRDAWFKRVKESKVTFTIAVSSHLNALRDNFFEFMSSGCNLRGLVSSSAFIDNSTKKKFFSIPGFDFYEMYGASEVGTATSLTKSDPIEKWGSVGKGCDGVKIKIVDADKNNVTLPFKIGEIAINSYMVSKGYLNRDSMNKEVFINDFFHSGDLGYLDNEGYLYFVDRKKDLIISGGSNIYPSDVEEVIKKFKGVADCCLIGLEDEYLVEVPIAFIIPSGGVNGLEKNIRSDARRELPPFQRPLKYIFCESFPQGNTGKLDKKRLREIAKSEYTSLSKKFLALKK